MIHAEMKTHTKALHKSPVILILHWKNWYKLIMSYLQIFLFTVPTVKRLERNNDQPVRKGTLKRLWSPNTKTPLREAGDCRKHGSEYGSTWTSEAKA